MPSFRILLLLFAGTLSLAMAQSPSFPNGVRRNYVCYRTSQPIRPDGRLNEAAWQAAPWSESFLDIEGRAKPEPRYRTRVKMLWDDFYLYIAAELEEPHLWATLNERESVIYMDNNFEVFVDPDGDGHLYYEWEGNAKGTEWDLLLVKAYRNGGPALNTWNLNGLNKGILLKGTLNDPSDRDEGWVLELALPWKALQECAPGRRPPLPGEQWRINFSRVEWDLEVKEGQYHKKINPDTGKPYPENNWIWSPPGLVNMHLPELWGYVQFSDLNAGEGETPFVTDPDEAIRWVLWELFYRQFDFFETQGRYAQSLEELNLPGIPVGDESLRPTLISTGRRYEASLPSRLPGKTWWIRDDGRIVRE